MREKCLEDPQMLCSPELLLDPAISSNQVEVHLKFLFELRFCCNSMGPSDVFNRLYVVRRVTLTTIAVLQKWTIHNQPIF